MEIDIKPHCFPNSGTTASKALLSQVPFFDSILSKCAPLPLPRYTREKIEDIAKDRRAIEIDDNPPPPIQQCELLVLW